MSKRVLIAMSGGVDSSVAASLMVERGYDCMGVTMLLHGTDLQAHKGMHCSNPQDAADAKAICERLGIAHQTVDLSKFFDEAVMQKFVRFYEEGLTPNPCVDCNFRLKFGKLYQLAKELGYDYIATGHYARVIEKEGYFYIAQAKNTKKDQSYALYHLGQEVLSHVFMPLGEYTKDEVRSLAKERNLITAQKSESMDICFVPDGNYVDFLQQYQGKSYEPGNLVDEEGHVLGQHKGAVAYTIGQRKGLGLAVPHPVYVVDKDMKTNTVRVGKNEELFARSLVATDWHATGRPLDEGEEVLVKIRYNSAPARAKIYSYTEEVIHFIPGTQAVRIVFEEPQRAIAPGQAAVAYEDGCVLGGGTILFAENGV